MASGEMSFAKKGVVDCADPEPEQTRMWSDRRNDPKSRKKGACYQQPAMPELEFHFATLNAGEDSRSSTT
jgi:hypothetical protein